MWRLRLVDLLVRRWRRDACPRFTFDPPVLRNRFAAERLVFAFGMMNVPILEVDREKL